MSRTEAETANDLQQRFRLSPRRARQAAAIVHGTSRSAAELNRLVAADPRSLAEIVAQDKIEKPNDVSIVSRSGQSTGG